MEPEYGVVAFLDVLGTKEMGRKQVEEISKFMDSFESLTDQVKQTAKSLYGTRRPHNFPAYRALTLSDTIVLTGSYKPDKLLGYKLDAIHLDITAILCSMIMKMSFEKEIYLRGGISLGEFYRKNTAIVGKAVSEVADYYERPQWIGISLTSSAHYAFTNAKGLNSTSNLVNHNINLKEIGLEIDAKVVNWPLYMANEYKRENNESAMQKHYEMIKKNCTDPNIANAIKWRNTKDFFERNAGMNG